jgi:Tfp pilus assembly protein FimT
MTIRTDKKPRSGFSLVEILLTLVLILCLAATSVFTFTTLYRSANLDEGYDRFQSLVRFAQAEAATTGHKVRLQFPARPVHQTNAADEKTELRNIQVTWEADALNAPGVFQSYTNKSWSEEMVNELVGVERVQSLQSPNTPPQTGSASVLAASTDETASADSGTTEKSDSTEFPTITFYPDGSCDSAEIVLASRNSEDERRVEVRLSGILGSVSSRTVSSDQLASNDNSTASQDQDALWDSSDDASSSNADGSKPQSY